MTAFGYIGPASISIKKKPLHDSPQAHEARQVQEHDRVALSESQIECAGVITVHYPRIALDEFCDLPDPFVRLRLHPAGAPVKLIKMVHFQLE